MGVDAKYDVQVNLGLKSDLGKQMAKAQRAMGRERAAGIKRELRAQERFHKDMARTRKIFARQAARATARSARAQERMIGGVGAAGGRMRGIGAGMAAGPMGRAGAAIGGAARAGGLAAAVGGGGMLAMGLRFNKQIEDATLSAGTMFQMFGLAEDKIGKAASESEQWAANLGLAKEVMAGLFEVAKKTPASFGQVSQAFQGMSAGLAITTKDIDRQLKFMEKASLLGGLTGGDYQVLGAQVGRMLAGSAGAEMNIWRVFQPTILKAGRSLGIFNQNMRVGSDMTMAFNKQSAETRIKLLEGALAAFGEPVRNAWATSMAGITSTTISNIQVISGQLTKPLFEAWRAFLVKINKAGSGVFGDKAMVRWEMIGSQLGRKLESSANYWLNALESGLTNINQNWDTITVQVQKAFEAGALVIKGALAFGAAKAATGVAVGVAGGGLAAFAGFAQVFAAIGPVALTLIPVVAMFGLMLGGLAVAFGGVAAFVVENWDQIVFGFQSGAITMRPIIAALEVMWAKMVGLGEALLGTKNVAVGAQTAIVAVAGGIELLTAFLYPLRIILGIITTFITGLTTIIWGLVKAFSYVVNAIWPAVNGDSSLENVADSLKETTVDYANLSVALFTAGDAAKAAKTSFLDFSESISDAEAFASEEKRFAARVRGMEQGTKAKPPTVPKAPGTFINKMENHWDLRGTDPDRLMSAFLPKLEKLADQRTQGFGQVPQGA